MANANDPGGPPPSANLLVAGGDIVTMNPAREVLTGGTVAVAGERIVAVGSTSELRALHPDAAVLDVRGCVVTPGLVNAHEHLTGDPLVRSCIPDLLPAGAAVFDWSVPFHAAHTGDHDELSALLASIEALRYGVTTVIEAGTVAHPDRVGKAMMTAGVRGTVGTWGWDIEGVPFAAPVDEILDREREMCAAWPIGGRVEGWVTLVGHNLASDALLTGASDLALELGTHMTMHMSPTSSDPETYLATHGRRPLAHLDHLGVLGPHLVLAHGVWLDDEEVELVLDTRTAIAYCPWAYLRTGQGVTQVGRHAEIVERGGRVALGCDASNAGDLADILRTAAVAAAIARDVRIDPTRFGAATAFELATIRGAEAIGMADRIGSIEVGKLADLAIHDTRTITWTPPGDYALHLVWGTDGRTVRDVVVGGEIVVRDRRCTRVDELSLIDDAKAAQAEIFAAAGISPTPTWPLVASE
jgi:5-methylthioadenosine/S-adenosylhomocysteine deaminase